MVDTDGGRWDVDASWKRIWEREMARPSRPLDQQDVSSEIGRLNAHGRGNSGFIAIGESEQFAVRVTQRF